MLGIFTELSSTYLSVTRSIIVTVTDIRSASEEAPP